MNKSSLSEIAKDLKHGSEILRSEKFRKTCKNIQHSDVSVMKHSIKVAKASVWLNKHLHANCKEKDLVRGALLHDYFLYDWHDPGHGKLHGFYHPGIALKNASKDYKLTETEKNIIESHMWPLTIKHIPKCKEAWVVSAADKYVSTVESLRLEKLYKDIKRKRKR